MLVALSAIINLEMLELFFSNSTCVLNYYLYLLFI